MAAENRIRNEEVAAMGWHQQREYFRKVNREWVRGVEGLSGPGTGRVRGPHYEHVRVWWEEGAPFDHVRGKGLERELEDLSRDARVMGLVAAVVPVVDSVVGRTFTPEMPDEALVDEKVFGEWMDRHIKKESK